MVVMPQYIGMIRAGNSSYGFVNAILAGMSKVCPKRRAWKNGLIFVEIVCIKSLKFPPFFCGLGDAIWTDPISSAEDSEAEMDVPIFLYTCLMESSTIAYLQGLARTTSFFAIYTYKAIAENQCGFGVVVVSMGVFATHTETVWGFFRLRIVG